MASNRPMAAQSHMKLKEFIAAIERLVVTWQPEDEQAGATRQRALAAIYAEMREEMAYDLAEAIRLRDEALKQLHRHHLGYAKEKK
jgi:hypothetical protein